MPLTLLVKRRGWLWHARLFSDGWIQCSAQALFQRRRTSREFKLVLAGAKPAVGPLLG
jgi:hypothetical protein